MHVCFYDSPTVLHMVAQRLKFIPMNAKDSLHEPVENNYQLLIQHIKFLFYIYYFYQWYAVFVNCTSLKGYNRDIN